MGQHGGGAVLATGRRPGRLLPERVRQLDDLSHELAGMVVMLETLVLPPQPDSGKTPGDVRATPVPGGCA